MKNAVIGGISAQATMRVHQDQIFTDQWVVDEDGLTVAQAVAGAKSWKGRAIMDGFDEKEGPVTYEGPLKFPDKQIRQVRGKVFVVSRTPLLDASTKNSSEYGEYIAGQYEYELIGTGAPEIIEPEAVYET